MQKVKLKASHCLFFITCLWVNCLLLEKGVCSENLHTFCIVLLNKVLFSTICLFLGCFLDSSSQVHFFFFFLSLQYWVWNESIKSEAVTTFHSPTSSLQQSLSPLPLHQVCSSHYLPFPYIKFVAVTISPSLTQVCSTYSSSGSKWEFDKQQQQKYNVICNSKKQKQLTNQPGHKLIQTKTKMPASDSFVSAWTPSLCSR